MNYDLSNGIAGQGLALLQCCSLLDDSFVETRLQDYVYTLLSGQQKDGSWEFYGALKEKKAINFHYANMRQFYLEHVARQI